MKIYGVICVVGGDNSYVLVSFDTSNGRFEFEGWYGSNEQRAQEEAATLTRGTLATFQ